MESFLSIFEEADPFRTWWPALFAVLVGLVIVIRTYMGGQCCPNSNAISQRIVIITGGNSGIGFELAKSLAARGARIILACRNLPAAERAVHIIKRELNCHSLPCTPEGGTTNEAKFQVEAHYLDLASFDNVQRFARQIAAAYDHIDVLVNNAGISFQSENKHTVDGFDLQLQVNYLSHFLLTHLLMPQLQRSPHGGRVVNVSAHAHMAAKNLDLHDPLNIRATAMKQHARDIFSHSKLAVLLCTRWWAEELKCTAAKNVTVNCCTPGLVRNTGHLRNSVLMSTLSVKLMTYPWMWLFMKTPSQGAQCAIYLVTDPGLKHVSGKYFNDCEMAESSEQGGDLKLAKNLYAQTVRALAKVTKLDIDKEYGSKK